MQGVQPETQKKLEKSVYTLKYMIMSSEKENIIQYEIPLKLESIVDWYRKNTRNVKRRVNSRY